MKIIVSYEDKEINGVAILPCDDIENDCIGIYATSSFKDITINMINFIKDDLKGKSYFMYVNDLNKHIEELIDIYNVDDLGKDMRLIFDEFNHTNIDTYIVQDKQINRLEEFKEEFVFMHDNLFPDIYWTGKRILEHIEKWEVVLEINNDILIGYTILSVSNESIYIQAIGVKEEYRQKGYGHKLMKRVINYAAMNKKCIILDVESSNIPALSLYKSLGFKVEKIKHLYKIKFE
jgi:ribosomal protein S18 acetylase RimI-like enzyme